MAASVGSFFLYNETTDSGIVEALLSILYRHCTIVPIFIKFSVPLLVASKRRSFVKSSINRSVKDGQFAVRKLTDILGTQINIG